MQRNEESSTALAASPKQLRIRDRRGRDQLIQLEDRITIGSSVGCSIRLDGIDPVHCFVVHGSAGTVLRKWQGDITINDVPVQDAWLRPGDVVRIGDNEIRLQQPSPPEAKASASTPWSKQESPRRLQVRNLAKKRVSSVLNALRQSRSELDAYRDRSAELSEQISTLQADCESLRQSVAGKDATIADLDGQLRDALTQASELHREIELLKQHVQVKTDEVEQTNAHWTQQAQALLTELSAPQESWLSIQSDTDAPRRYLELISAYVASAVEAAGAAPDRSQEFAELEARNEQIEQRSREINEQIGEIEQRYAELEQIRASLDQTRTELENAQSEFTSQKESWEVEQHNLIAQYDSVRHAYEQERSAFEAERDQASSQSEVERDQLRQELEAKSAECEELRIQIESFNAAQSVNAADEFSVDPPTDPAQNEFAPSAVPTTDLSAAEFGADSVGGHDEFCETPLDPSKDAASPYATESDFSNSEIQSESSWEESPALAEETPQENSEFTPDTAITSDEFSATEFPAAEYSDNEFSNAETPSAESFNDEVSTGSPRPACDFIETSDAVPASESFADGPAGSVDASEFQSETPTEESFTSDEPTSHVEYELTPATPGNDFGVESGSDYIIEEGSEYASDYHSGDYRSSEDSSNEFASTEETSAETFEAPSTEEIEFSSVNNEAPIDTASILAKFGVEANAEDDGFDEPQLASPSVDPPTPALPEASMPGNDGGGDESDECIDEYMAQLLNRVGGGSTQPKSDAESVKSTAEEVVNRSIEAVEREESPEEEELPPLRPEDFVPRSKAPTVDLNSMRSIANETARSAIDRHWSKKNRNTLLMQWFMAICLVIAGVILVMFGTLLTQVGAGLAFVLGVYMGLRAAGIITSSRSMGQKLAGIKEKKQKKQRKKKLPKK